MELAVLPAQHGVFSAINSVGKNTEDPVVKQLRNDNNLLSGKLANLKSLERENAALHDQFMTSKINPEHLLPAHVIGLSEFVPGVAQPGSIILDKGSDDGVHVGSIAIYEDNLVGKIVRLSSHLAILSPIGKKDMTITGRDTETNALGIIKGQGNGVMILENVLSSDKVTAKDLVVTKGDIDEKGIGYPPDIVIGQIVSIDKNPSDIFQAAAVKSLLDLDQLNVVFLITANR